MLFFTGFSVLCACPGWYALAAAFAGIAVWAGNGRMRVWAIVCLVASLVFAGLDTFAKIEEHRKFIENEQRMEQMQHGTNTSAQR